MWYGGSTKPYMEEKIGYATSNDGRNWTKYAGNPVMSNGSFGSWDNAHIGSMSVIKDGSTYKMWYYGNNGNIGRIGYATSTDGINWTKYADNPVMDLGAGNAWDSKEIGPNCVIKDADGYKMWYGGSDGNHSRVGYANSTDGINWTRYANNPVIGIGAANAWDDNHVGYFCVVNVSGTFHGWYGGDSGTNWGIGYASSTDGKIWTKYASNPVMSRNGTDWEMHDNLCPWIIWNGFGYQMWYTGVSNASSPWVYKFGYAIGGNTIPDAPWLLAPADDIWTNDNRPTFCWTFSDPDAQDVQTAYQIQVDDDYEFSSVDYDSGKVSSAATSHAPIGGIADGIYYWRARVWDSDNDNSTWSPSRIIKIDTVPPMNPGVLWSPSHIPGVWSNDNTIWVSFAGPGDVISGHEGYSYLWDFSSSSLPDTSMNLRVESGNLTSPPMSDSDSIYFHIRAKDFAGNWNGTAAHLGPFWIDSTPPENPSNVSSPDLLPEHWSNNATITMIWNEADASISGVSGYSFLWDNDSITIPPIDLNASADILTATSPSLSDGNSWYFHLRTKDNAGNWATTTVHRGPYYIDTVAPVALMIQLNATVDDADFTVGWTGSDANSGIQSYDIQYRDNNSSWTDWMQNVTLTNAVFSGQDGHSYSFRVRAQDRASNSGAYPLDVSNSVRIDIPGPIVTILRPAAGAVVSSRYTITGTAGHPKIGMNITLVQIQIDGGGWQAANGTSSWNLNLDTTGLKNGPHAIQARAFDGAKYSPTMTIDFEVKNEKIDVSAGGFPWIGLVIVILAAVILAGYVIMRRQALR
jgi:predicted GH43/DUF377 family glycosyl hydrolase